MIGNLIQRVTELWTAVMNMPLEGQVITGVGMLVVIAALRNIWGVLFPIRWTVAYILRGGAFVLHPRRRNKKNSIEKTEEAPPWDISTKKSLIQLFKFYSKKNRVVTLSDEKLNQLSLARNIFDTYIHENGELAVIRELKKRENERKLRQLANQNKES